jgi:hypothetical protein
MSEPTVFISYSHDSDDHKEWVRQLASDLRERGVDALLDQWDLVLGQDVAAFMEGSISKADRVLLVCTERYVEKAEGAQGGVGYERLIVTGELVGRIDTKKFIPIVRQRASPARTPRFLGPRLYIDFSNDSDYQEKLDQLAREIHGIPLAVRPPLGSNPYAAGVPSPPDGARVAGPTGLTTEANPVLREGWFSRHSEAAQRGLASRGRTGALSVRFALQQPVGTSQLQLLDAVRRSTIRTFGWPIGVLLENRAEFRPKPTSDGIFAEVSIAEKSISGRASYDYWAVRTNGDFFAVQSFFEDERTENALFFNTRIVRIAEALLLAANLYGHLGVPDDAVLSVSIGHQGLSGRQLGSSNLNRDVLPATSHEERSETTLLSSVASLRANTTEHVMQVGEPLFILFDFTRFDRSVYHDIVSKFKDGHVT